MGGLAELTESATPEPPACGEISGITHHRDSPWPERELELLRLWSQNLSHTEIAIDMGLTPGQVAGRLHRMRAAGRLGQRCLDARRRQPPNLTEEQEQARRAKISASLRTRFDELRAAYETLQDGAEPQDTPATEPRPEPPQEAPGRHRPTCCWPIGEPGTPGYRECGRPPLPRQPYCEQHHATAHMPRPRSQAA